MEIIKYFSTFSGIRGFKYGIEKVSNKFKCIGHSEIDKYAEAISKYHYPEDINYGDATRINWNEVEDFDIFVGGFPCQSFSIAGKRKGFDDTRGTLFFEIARALSVKRPKLCVLENVKGLLSHDKGRTFETILSTLFELGYICEWQVLNSKNFGVPQNRERVFIIGHLGEISGQTIFPIKNGNKEIDTPGAKRNISGTISTKNQSGQCQFDGSTTLIGTLRTFKDGEGFREIKENISPAIPARARNDGSGQPCIICDSGPGRKLQKRNNVAPLRSNTGAGHGNYIVHNMQPRSGDPRKGGTGHLSNDKGIAYCCDTGSTNAIELNQSIRRLTPIECERLQGFTTIKKSIIFNICLGHQNNYANAETQNPKLHLPAGNVEKKESKESVQYVEKNLNTKNQQIKKPVQKDVHIYCEDKIVQIRSQEKLLLNVSNAEKKEKYPQHINHESFALIIAGINTIAEKIINYGKVELHQSEQCSIHQKNGKIFVNLYGKSLMQLVRNAEKNLITPKKLLKSIILNHSNIEDLENQLKILFLSVINAIIGYIPKEIKTKDLLTIEIESDFPWTKYGFIDNQLIPISDTQRYKCCGNAVTTNVIQAVFEELYKYVK